MTTAADPPVLVAPAFEGFPSIPRLSREVIITEKIDGTNAQIYVGEDGVVIAASRNGWIDPTRSDPFGFAWWVKAHEEELRAGLGAGRHFGEWWGMGIQRKYGLPERRFSLFNVTRWADPASRPACCHVVPVLWRGEFTTDAVDAHIEKLQREGSVAAPGFMRPEGVVVFHVAANAMFKKTIGDDGHKQQKGPRP